MGSCFKFGLLKKKNFYEFQHPYLEKESSGTYRHSKTDLSNWKSGEETIEIRDSHHSAATTNAGDVVFVANPSPKEERSVDVQGFMSSPEKEEKDEDTKSVSSSDHESDLEYPPDSQETVTKTEEEHVVEESHTTEEVPEPEGYATEYIVETTTVTTETVPDSVEDSFVNAECQSVESDQSDHEEPSLDNPSPSHSYSVTTTEVVTTVTSVPDSENIRSSTVSNASSNANASFDAEPEKDREHVQEVKQVNFHDSANEVYTPSQADYSFSSSEAESHQNEQNEEAEGLQSSVMVNVDPELDHYGTASEEITLDVNNYIYESPTRDSAPEEHAELY